MYYGRNGKAYAIDQNLEKLLPVVGYILNKSPTSALENMNPYEPWFDKKMPNCNHL